MLSKRSESFLLPNLRRVMNSSRQTNNLKEYRVPFDILAIIVDNLEDCVVVASLSQGDSPILLYIAILPRFVDDQ